MPDSHQLPEASNQADRDLSSTGSSDPTQWSPLPPPSILAEYEKHIKGAAERIFIQFETEGNHRRNIENQILQYQIKRSYVGIAAGLAAALLTLLAAFILALSNHTVVASILGGLDIVALAGVFVVGRISRRAERIEKAKIQAILEDDLAD